MNRSLLESCVRASYDGSKKFPEIVGALTKEGVESYHVDMIRAENRYYMPNGDSEIVATGADHPTPKEDFSAEMVAAAVRKSQAGQITYPQFLEEVAQAGTVFYVTYLTGKKVVYFGRKGESHTEYFPGSR